MKESKDYLFQAVSIEPENTKYMSNLGYLSLKTGNRDEAKKYCLTVLEFDPNDKIARKMLEELR